MLIEFNFFLFLIVAKAPEEADLQNIKSSDLGDTHLESILQM